MPKYPQDDGGSIMECTKKLPIQTDNFAGFRNYSPPKNAIVETDQVTLSGSKGASAMFSRAGVGTIASDLRFYDELKGSEGIPTTFPPSYFRQNEVIEEEAVDEEALFATEYKDFKTADT